MVTEILTKEMIESGAAFLRKLDENGVPPKGVFWLYFPEAEEWRLVIVDERLAELGPRHIYQEIQKLLDKFQEDLCELDSLQITVARPDTGIVPGLRAMFHTGPGISGIRVKNTPVQGGYIEGAHIYRMNWPNNRRKAESPGSTRNYAGRT